jgi:hypothetical protein
MSWVTSSHFAKYFYDIYSEYITPCVVMTYATFDAIRVTPPWLSTLCSRAMILSNWVDNMTDNSQEKIGQPFIYSNQWIYFHIIYCPLYMLIMQVYHDSACMRDFGCMPDSSRKMRLWSYARLHSEDMTLVIYPDFNRTSRLQSYLLTPVAQYGSGRWVCHMSYHLSCERLRMAGLDDCNILQSGHLVRSRLRGMHDSFSIQNLNISHFHMFKSQAMCRSTNEHLACFDLRETWVFRRTWYPL